MSDNVLIIAAGIVVSVAFNWIPKLKDKYGALDDNYQRLVMLGVLAVAALLLFGASCTGFQIPGVTLSVTCDQKGAQDLVQLFINAVVANQVAFLALPKPTK